MGYVQGKLLAAILISFTSGCGTAPSQARSTCLSSMPQSSLRIQDGTETADYPSVVLIMSGPRVGSVAKCTGTIVGHNTVLTAAHCIKGTADYVYVMQTLSLRGAEHNRAMASAISPRAIISHGPFVSSATNANISELPEDLVVLLFAADTFQQRDVIVPSLYGRNRPENFSDTIMVGFGKSSASDTSDTSIKRVGFGFYLTEDFFGPDLVFTFDRDLDPQSFAPVGGKKYSQTQQGDSGGPLFFKRDNQLEIVGVTSAGGTSSDGQVSRSIYVDLYSEKSLDLFARASEQGAHFTEPSEFRAPGASASPNGQGTACIY
jgi:hypothetical protein